LLRLFMLVIIVIGTALIAAIVGLRIWDDRRRAALTARERKEEDEQQDPMQYW
jgi:hypothetical protein